MLQYSPKIVTDSLVMCLDASQNKSYPTDLPVKNGLALWLDAADDSTFSYSSGTSVSQWRDKSGSNFHASQATVGSQPSRSTFQNSRKTVNFDGTNDTVTIPNFVSNSEMSIFVVSNCGTSLFIEHSTDVASSATGFYIYGGGNGMFLIRRNSTYYYSSLTNWLAGGYSIASGVNSTGLDLLTYKDGTQQTPTFDGRSSLSNSYATNTLYIGSRGANSVWSSGPIAEIIIYNRKVTDTERKQIHTYLGQKWGISNTDRSIVDLSNNNIASFGGAAGSQTVANMPTFDFYNKGALRFDGGDYVQTTTTVLPVSHTSPFTLEAFCCPSTVSVAYQTVLGTMSSFSQIGFVNNTFAAGRNGGGGGLLRNSLATVVANTWYHICMTYNGTNASFYLNGSFLSTQTIGTNGINNGVSLLGSYSSSSPSETFNGTIAAARIYNKVLSAAEVLQNYEAQKSKFANTIVQQGLMLHLDAENPSSYAGAGTVWYDVSGNGYNAGMNNITPSNWVTYNGVKAFETNDTNNQNFTVGSFPFPQSGRTYEIWINSKSFSLGWQSWFDDGGGERVLFGTSTNTMHVYPSVEVSANLVVGQWYQLLYTMVGGNGTAVVVYKDGQSIGSGTYGYALSSGTGILFILGDSGSEITSCYCSTVRVYNRVLSAAEVLQNYNATKGKFGL